MTDELIGKLAIKVNEDCETVKKCLELFKLRFKSDYEALMQGKEYPLRYFAEWCERLKKNPMDYADNETKKALRKIGY